MERITSIEQAKEIMGENFIGPLELLMIKNLMCYEIDNLLETPIIPFQPEYLKNFSNSHILILGIPYNAFNKPLSLKDLRLKFGIDPFNSEPCFYNQDWYINELFFNSCTIESKWYLIRKNVKESMNGTSPLDSNVPMNYLPSALLVAYVFFCWYFYSRGEILWKNEYVWCSDLDNNLDRVYVGRYIDISGKNKNGFSIHRHLKLTKQYGYVDFR